MTPAKLRCAKCGHLAYHHENAERELTRCFYWACRCRAWWVRSPNGKVVRGQEPRSVDTGENISTFSDYLDRLPWDA